MLKFGIEMHLPDGKRPGYYAQVVKALADVPLFDRDKEMLIVSDQEALDKVLALMEQYKFEYDELELLLLPAGSVIHPVFTDYGFESRMGNLYLLENLIVLFQLETLDSNLSSDKEMEQAHLQMEEHLIVSYEVEGLNTYVVDRTLTDLMHGIAKAYRCKVHLVDPANV